MANAAVIMYYLSPMAQGMLMAEGGTVIDPPVQLHPQWQSDDEVE